ncbi:MAG TPA: response regulator, partial [Rhodanobacteraceae bacterium]|nr:response regulator [Rhodanobacteraceae bacterium]
MSASPRIASPHDHLDRLDAPSIARLKAVVRDLHGQCRSGWDINLIQRLHEELGLLAGLCNHAGQLQLGEQLLALETALGPALTRQRVPDTGTTALVAALADHLRVLIPVTAPEPATAAPPQTAPTTATAPNGREKADPLRLLIASLRPDVAAHLAASLPTGSGYTLRILSEPLAALEELSRFAPDCVICDLKMPVCDGPDLAAMIHERADFADLPVLYLSIAGEAPSDADTLPADIDAQSLDACVRERVATRQQRQRQNATTQLDHRRGQYRRAWLLDRLDACLTAGNPRGGLLDISIDGAAALQRQHGNHAVTVMHEQLSDAINELLAAGDMLASSGAG